MPGWENIVKRRNSPKRLSILLRSILENYLPRLVVLPYAARRLLRKDGLPRRTMKLLDAVTARKPWPLFAKQFSVATKTCRACKPAPILHLYDLRTITSSCSIKSRSGKIASGRKKRPLMTHQSQVAIVLAARLRFFFISDRHHEHPQ